MHELALSQSIVRTALSASGAEKADITAIAVDVGALSAVVPSSLEFCLQLVLEQSGMQSTQVRITRVEARAMCECGLTFEPTDLFSPCPECGGFQREIERGKDVTIRYVEVEDGEG